MAHAHHQFHRAPLGGLSRISSSNGIRAVTPSQRKALGAEIALLQDLLEQVGANQ